MTIMQAGPSAPSRREIPPPATVVAALAAMFSRIGAEEAFGVSGGAMATLWDALSASALGVRHFRHEAGATFAAIEAYFASGRPVVLFTTTGPGLRSVNPPTSLTESSVRSATGNPYDAPTSTKVAPNESATRHAPLGCATW